jgi:small-conductance mechanosensitive channel
MKTYLQSLDTIVWSLGLLAGAVVVGLIVHYILFATMERVARRTQTIVDDSSIKNFRRPLQLLIPLLAISLILPTLSMPPTILVVLKHLLSLGIIASIAWLFVRTTDVLDDIVLSRYRIDEKDNLQARKIYTQLQVFKRIIIVVVSILALATMLLTFDKVRQLGTGILASAGIIGIILGLSAQRTIGTILAGLQIAITQPIRLDDVVIVENEWGRIEEITFTYVVVRIWDLRRLVLPITYFIEKPFQNWTRVTADILGTVFIYVDYTVPVQAVREEFHRILKGSSYWNGTTWGLQVTNSTDRAVELRALMSASDASSAWNLRCEVREKLIEFIRKNYPDGLPKVRAELQEAANLKALPGDSTTAGQSLAGDKTKPR